MLEGGVGVFLKDRDLPSPNWTRARSGIFSARPWYSSAGHRRAGPFGKGRSRGLMRAPALPISGPGTAIDDAKRLIELPAEMRMVESRSVAAGSSARSFHCPTGEAHRRAGCCGMYSALRRSEEQKRRSRTGCEPFDQLLGSHQVLTRQREIDLQTGERGKILTPEGLPGAPGNLVQFPFRPRRAGRPG